MFIYFSESPTIFASFVNNLNIFREPDYDA